MFEVGCHGGWCHSPLGSDATLPPLPQLDGEFRRGGEKRQRRILLACLSEPTVLSAAPDPRDRAVVPREGEDDEANKLLGRNGLAPFKDHDV